MRNPLRSICDSPVAVLAGPLTLTFCFPVTCLKSSCSVLLLCVLSSSFSTWFLYVSLFYPIALFTVRIASTMLVAILSLMHYSRAIGRITVNIFV